MGKIAKRSLRALADVENFRSQNRCGIAVRYLRLWALRDHARRPAGLACSV